MPFESSAVGRLIRDTVLRPGRTVVVPFGVCRGVRLEVDPEAPVHLYVGSLEAELRGAWRRILRPDLVSWDVGSHEGAYAFAFARRTGGEVVAIECNADALGRLRRNIAANGVTGDRVRVVETFVDRAAGPDREGVPVRTLDELLADDTPAPGLLKIDVEGGEGAVLAGATEVLRTHRPAVVVETHGPGPEEEAAAILRDADYRVLLVPQRERLREHRPNPRNRWLVAEPQPAAG